MKTLKTTFFTLVSCAINSLTVLTAICAALSFGKWNSPVEIQQNATLSRPFSAANSRQER